jgi:hypothetical protein
VTPVSMLDGGPLPLRCAGPLRQMLVPAPSGTNAGVPEAGIVWNGDHCELTADEHAPGMVLLIADITYMGGELLTAARADRWVITSSSTGAGPTTYITSLMRDTDIRVDMDRADDAIRIVLRIEEGTLVLVSMARR